MEKELGDERGGPWWHRCSNTFQVLSLNKWVIGWPHRVPPSSQSGPLSASLALLVLWQPPNPTAEADSLSLLHGQTEDQWEDLPHLACQKPRCQDRGFALRQQKWEQTSSKSLDSRGEQTCSYIIPPPLLSAMWKGKTLPDSTGSHLILKTWVKRSLWQYCSLKLWQPIWVPADSTFQEMTFAAGAMFKLINTDEVKSGGVRSGWTHLASLVLSVCNALPGLQRWIWALCPSKKLLGVS